MAVLIEAISVVIRADALLAAYKDDWDAFKHTVPNRTMCADGELVRVGFMSPEDVEGYVRKLSEAGLIYLDHGAAKDLVVVDQMRGPLVPCEWIEFGHVNLDNDPSKRVAVCSLRGKHAIRFAPTGRMDVCRLVVGVLRLRPEPTHRKEPDFSSSRERTGRLSKSGHRQGGLRRPRSSGRQTSAIERSGWASRGDAVIRPAIWMDGPRS